jgi:hypothetical protein
MDAFEQVIAGLLFQEGYWVNQSFKVELTKEEKKEIGRPSSPRWEVDLLAYCGTSNELLVVECKSYLDSGGVTAAHITEGNKAKSRYKLFVDKKLREVVFRRLAAQTHELGLTPAGLKPRLALAAGKIRNEKDMEMLTKHFQDMGWKLFDPHWIVSHLLSSADESYFDSIPHVVSKLIKRNNE